MSIDSCFFYTDLNLSCNQDNLIITKANQSTNEKIKRIQAYYFHPDRTSIFSFLLNVIKEFFYYKTAVRLHVKDQVKPLYVKVEALLHNRPHINFY